MHNSNVLYSHMHSRVDTTVIQTTTTQVFGADDSGQESARKANSLQPCASSLDKTATPSVPYPSQHSSSRKSKAYFRKSHWLVGVCTVVSQLGRRSSRQTSATASRQTKQQPALQKLQSAPYTYQFKFGWNGLQWRGI